MNKYLINFLIVMSVVSIIISSAATVYAVRNYASSERVVTSRSEQNIVRRQPKHYKNAELKNDK